MGFLGALLMQGSEQPARQPLTDGQLRELKDEHKVEMVGWMTFHRIARIVERAHGITKPKRNKCDSAKK
jgi:hypothetical protein